MIKDLILQISPLSNKYKQLLLDNCLCDINDNLIEDVLFDVIIYGNIISRCNKKLNVHSRLHTINEQDKHQISTEFETFQRIKLPFFWIIMLCLLILFIQLILIFIKL